MKSYKMPYIIYADMEFLIKKKMDMQITEKTIQQQKQMSILLVDIQCQ